VRAKAATAAAAAAAVDGTRVLSKRAVFFSSAIISRFLRVAAPTRVWADFEPARCAAASSLSG
jgi:hypothetical protein